MPHFSLEQNFNRSSDRVLKRVRELAKTSYWQSIFGAAKELGFKIFINERDFSDLQLLFLNYLSFYASLNMDIAIGDVTDIVLDNEIYEDAYMHFKNKSDKKKSQEKSVTPRNSNTKEERNPQTNWVFRKPKKA